MLGVRTALIGHEVRADIEREFGGVGRATGEHSVDIYLIAFTGCLDSTLSIGIIPVIGDETVVKGTLNELPGYKMKSLSRKKSILMMCKCYSLIATVIKDK